MNPKTKLAFINHFNNQGFAVPLALGIGLLMILAGTTMLVRSQGDQAKVASQKVKAQGLSVTEVAVARFQDLINNNRIIATYPSCNNTDYKSTTCDTDSWAKATNSTKLKDLLKTCKNGTWQNNTTNVQNSASTAWQYLDSNDKAKGQYRIVGYTYAPAAGGTVGQAPGNGTLVIEGRVNQNLDGTKSSGESISRIEVRIPVRDTTDDQPVPGLWLQTGATGGNKIVANVLANDCAAVKFTYESGKASEGTGASQIKIDDTDTTIKPPYDGEFTTMPFPSLPKTTAQLNAFSTNNKLGTLNNNTKPATPTPTGSCVLAAAIQKNEFPRVGDTMNTTNGVFEYVVDGTNKANIIIRPSCKVIFHLKGNIDKGTEITHSCLDSANKAIANCKPTDFQIFGYGGTGSSICVNGNRRIEAFILAPNYEAGAAGTGGGKGGIKGAIWVNSWGNGGGCGSNTSNEVVVQTAEWSDITVKPNFPPEISNVSSWEQRPVQ